MSKQQPFRLDFEAMIVLNMLPNGGKEPSLEILTKLGEFIIQLEKDGLLSEDRAAALYCRVMTKIGERSKHRSKNTP